MTRWLGLSSGGSIEGDSRIYLGTGQTRGLLVIALELEELASDGSCQGASKTLRGTNRRAARRRQEEMTVPGEKGLGGLLAESVQQVARPVNCSRCRTFFPKTRRWKASGCVVSVEP